jgi:hypothetical protein
MKRILSTLVLAISALAIDFPGPISPAQAAACTCRPGPHDNCPQGYHCKTGGCPSGGAPSSFNFTGRCSRNPGGGSSVLKPKSFSVQPHGHPPAKGAGPRLMQAR